MFYVHGHVNPFSFLKKISDSHVAKPEEKVAKEVKISTVSFWEEPFPEAVTASGGQRTDRLLGNC